ncbi:MAG: DUF1570 domain-containing protein [Mariniblastus sp.]
MTPFSPRRLIIAVLCAIVLMPWVIQESIAQSQPEMTVEIPYKKRKYVGQPLVWDGKDMMILRRDGKISILPVKSERDYTKVKNSFKPYSHHEIRVQLQNEFGAKYQVSTTANFVVVHPPGSAETWSMPFQKLYSRFRAYFSSQGFRLKRPEFPMVAVILRTRGEFDRFLRKYHPSAGRNVLGYYAPRSNRIITYDQTGGQTKGQSWFFHTDTIIHEATHQTAFNTGVHSRYNAGLRWASEGLAMLFEAPGVNNSMYYTRQKDRINRDRLIALKKYYAADRLKGKMGSLILSDNLFRSDPQMAYAMAWGMTFFFTEKMPNEYNRFLRNDAKRADFSSYPSNKRASDFAKAFGSNTKGLEAQMKRFIEGLDIPPARR